MSTLTELKHLREREDHVEFKEAKKNFPFAGGNREDIRERRKCVLGYVVALANEKGGRLVLGMADRYPHQVVGSNFAEGETGQLEDEIYRRLSIRVHVEELYEGKLCVVVLNIPSRPVGKALRFEGVPLMRTGESLREMDDAEYYSIISESEPDFSANTCEGIEIKDLDDNAVAAMRRLVAEKTNRQEMATLPLIQVLTDLNLCNGDGKLTYAALILLGKTEAIQAHLPQHNVVVEFRVSHSDERYSARKEFRQPLFLLIDQLWDYLNQPASNPLLHVSDMPKIYDIPAFDRTTIREAILNACIHRSFQQTGDIQIRQYPDVMEIINPGGFPYGVNVNNVLTVPSSPRNRLLAETVEKTGWIERSGQGANIMFGNCVKDGKPLPDYSNTDDYMVCLQIQAVIANPQLFLFLHHWDKSLNSYELINLYHIYRGQTSILYENNMERLISMGAVQTDELYRYTMGRSFFEVIYRSLTDQFDAEIIRTIYYATRQDGGAPSSEIIQRLSNLLSPKQCRTMISKLCDLGYLSPRGKSRATTYVWVK